MRFTWLTIILASLAAWTVMAAQPGYTDYIIALKSNDPKSMKAARKDVELEGGKVKMEITLGVTALVASLPNDKVSTFEEKDYVDFIERDQEVHIAKH